MAPTAPLGWEGTGLDLAVLFVKVDGHAILLRFYADCPTMAFENHPRIQRTAHDNLALKMGFELLPETKQPNAALLEKLHTLSELPPAGAETAEVTMSEHSQLTDILLKYFTFLLEREPRTARFLLDKL